MFSSTFFPVLIFLFTTTHTITANICRYEQEIPLSWMPRLHQKRSLIQSHHQQPKYRLIPDEGIQFQIDFAKTSYAAGEPFTIRVIATNKDRDSDIRFLKWKTPWSQMMEDTFAVTVNGTKNADFLGYRIKRDPKFVQEGDFIVVAPKKTAEIIVNLSELYDLTPVGSYEIALRSTFREFTEDVEKGQPQKHIRMLSSNKLQFTVQPRPKSEEEHKLAAKVVNYAYYQDPTAAAPMNPGYRPQFAYAAATSAPAGRVRPVQVQTARAQPQPQPQQQATRYYVQKSRQAQPVAKAATTQRRVVVASPRAAAASTTTQQQRQQQQLVASPRAAASTTTQQQRQQQQQRIVQYYTYQQQQQQRQLQQRQQAKPVARATTTTATTPTTTKPQQPRQEGTSRIIATFENCNADQKLRLVNATRSFDLMVSKMYDLLHHQSVCGPIFQTFFGNAPHEIPYAFKNVSHVVSKLYGIQNLHFVCNAELCQNRANVVAYVKTGNTKNEISICDLFYQRPVIGDFDTQGGTMIHELSHLKTIADTHDIVYGRTNAIQLSDDEYLKALDNADNFEYYGESLVLGRSL